MHFSELHKIPIATNRASQIREMPAATKIRLAGSPWGRLESTISSSFQPANDASEHMEITNAGRTIDFREKHITLLDRFVLDFIRVLEPQTPYVIVSGYVAILFGRSRGTEDVDILIPRLEKAEFIALHDALLRDGYEFLNAEDAGGLYEMLAGNMGIRAAKTGRFIPNIELKFFKDEVDRSVFQNRVEVVFPDAHVYISPIEIQIAYKIWLGSPKDIEDALFLFEIFSNDLDKGRLKEQMKAFHVSGDEYGIIL